MKRAGQSFLPLLSALALILFAACGPSSGGGDGDGDGDGDACESSTNCLGGQICDPDTNTCADTKDCTDHPECGKGGFCNTGTGQCEPSSTGTPCADEYQCQEGETCVGADNTTGGFCGCEGEEFEPMPVEPNMLIVLDRSGSMGDPAGSGQPDKWDVAEEAIGQLMTDFDGMIRFGLAMFPHEGNSCSVPTVPNDLVSIGDNQGTNIMSAISAAGPGGSTPTGDTFDALLSYTGLMDPTRPNYITLVSDGAETCGGDAPSVATQHFNQGTRTFVIGFGDGIDRNELNAIAINGGTARMMGGDEYYQADSPQELQQAFDEIGGSVLACSFTINADEFAQVYVYGNGMPLDFDYDAGTMTVTVNGVDCDSLRTGSIEEVVVVNSCPISND